MTGWTKNVDVHYAAGTTGTATACCQFSNNEFTVVTQGFYSICGWLRFKKGGKDLFDNLVSEGASQPSSAATKNGKV